ncbi:MAG: tRNA 2-thiouridine(34) synthase MnmA [Pseudomonadota bacterium]
MSLSKGNTKYEIRDTNLVAVAMSGGVDSSAAAAILKEQGYSVVGINLRLWDLPDHLQASKTCCSTEDRRDAKTVCDILDIPFKLLDLRKEFENLVIDSFVSDYRLGRTPNPCILCNEHVKFKLLFDYAKTLGAKYLATGHYVNRIEINKHFTLSRAKDSKKDQSYFLFSISPENLKNIIFPNADFTKDEIRNIAQKHKLPIFKKNDSQEICFIEDNNHHRFIRAYLNIDKKEEGYFVDIHGNKLKKHEGIDKYTIGQRRGMGIANSTPLYISNIDQKTNQITVSDKKYCYAKNLKANNANWFLKVDQEFKAQAKIRNNHAQANCTVKILSETCFELEFEEEQFAITPGQAAVVYKDDILLGGGWIE